MAEQKTVYVNSRNNFVSKWKYLLTAVLIIVLILMIFFRIRIKVTNDAFAREIEQFASFNKSTVFSIDGIYMFSSAGATTNVDPKPEWNLNIFQFTDIALYINNRSSDDLNKENAIKSLKISNINFSGMKIGKQSLYYKNINNFGKSKLSSVTNDSEAIEKDKINGELSYTVLANEEIDYDKSTMFEDASIPICLEYVNNNVKDNEIFSNINDKINYNGSLLRNANVNLNDLAGYVSFTIEIENYLGHVYRTTINLDIPLQDSITGETIYDGKYVNSLAGEGLIKFYRVK